MKITLVDYIDACACVSKHVPLPHKLYRVDYHDGSVLVCPTTYLNLVSLEEEYVKYDGLPPGSIRKHYSEYVHELFRRINN